MGNDTEQSEQSDQELLQHQFTTVFEHLLNVSQFDPPFVLVLLDADDNVLGNKIVESSEGKNVLSATDFVSSEGAEEGLLYPLHLMVRDVDGCVAYVYLDDIDALPEIMIVHVAE